MRNLECFATIFCHYLPPLSSGIRLIDGTHFAIFQVVVTIASRRITDTKGLFTHRAGGRN
jgi:hypothetical protein